MGRTAYTEPQCLYRGALYLFLCKLILASEIVAWHRRLVAGVFPRSTFFDTGPLHVKFVLDKMTGGLEFCPSAPVSPVGITSPMLHTHTDYYEKDRRAKPGNLQSKKCSLECRQTLGRNVLGRYSFVFKVPDYLHSQATRWQYALFCL
jgi:hypothetical protein